MSGATVRPRRNERRDERPGAGSLHDQRQVQEQRVFVAATAPLLIVRACDAQVNCHQRDGKLSVRVVDLADVFEVLS